jgi:hypothetical protein
MVDRGSIGKNGELASSSPAFSVYGPATSPGFTPSAENRSVLPVTDIIYSSGWYGNSRQWSPASPYKTVSGQTQVEGVAQGGIPVRVYDRSTGELLATVISDISGNFELPSVGRSSVMVISVNSPYNAIIFDNVAPL